VRKSLAGRLKSSTVLCKLRKNSQRADTAEVHRNRVGRGYVLREPADDDMRVPAE